MTVPDEQVATLRALLTDDMPQYRRLFDGLDRAAAKKGVDGDHGCQVGRMPQHRDERRQQVGDTCRCRKPMPPGGIRG